MKNVNFRSKSTVKRRLSKFPVKYLIFKLLYFLINFRYVANCRENEAFEEDILHPGTNYD
jgi:hypothetical protein